MLSKKTVIGFTALFLLFTASPVFALSSDLQYQFSTENQEEFVQKGETNVHFNGAVPDYLLNIYDLTPQQVNNSEFGATIIVPEKAGPNSTTYAPANAPSSGYTQSPNGLITGALEGGQTVNSGASSSGGSGGNTNTGNSHTSTYPSYYQPDWEDKKQYPITSIEEVRESDGSIGVLKIPSIDLKVTAYDGEPMPS